MKSKRQNKIFELIQQHEVETQGELTKLLAEAGFGVTQATVSRDIREMMLTKAPSSSGGHKYALSTAAVRNDQEKERLTRVFRDGLVSIDYAGNLLVIRTLNGMAMAVAAALDAMRITEIVGSIAGDDVVMCAIKTEAEAIALMEKLKR